MSPAPPPELLTARFARTRGCVRARTSKYVSNVCKRRNALEHWCFVAKPAYRSAYVAYNDPQMRWHHALRRPRAYGCVYARDGIGASVDPLCKHAADAPGGCLRTGPRRLDPARLTPSERLRGTSPAVRPPVTAESPARGPFTGSIYSDVQTCTKGA